MNNSSTSNGFIVGILVLVVIILVGFLAYNQGYFKANTEKPKGVQIQLGGNSNP